MKAWIFVAMLSMLVLGLVLGMVERECHYRETKVKASRYDEIVQVYKERQSRMNDLARDLETLANDINDKYKDVEITFHRD